MNPAIESDADLMADVDDNPIRYMVQACGANYPLVAQQENEVVQVTGEGTYAGFAYYEEATGNILLFALTDQGYRELTALLIAHGMEIPTEPDIRLHIPMGMD